jgi:hypothetical protein
LLAARIFGGLLASGYCFRTRGGAQCDMAVEAWREHW